MRKACLGVLLVLALLMPWMARANPAYAAACDGCTALQMKDKAESIAFAYHADRRATAMGYYGFVYVYDLRGDSIEEYGVRLSDKRGGLVSVAIGPAPVEVRANFEEQRAAILSNGGSNVFYFSDNYRSAGFPEPGANAFDVVQFGSMQKTISDWMLKGASTNSWALLGLVTDLFLKDNKLTIDVVFTLADGSEITMEFEAGTNEARLVKAYDVNRNPIPFTIDKVPGDYRFPHGGEGKLGTYLNDRFGLSIPGAPVCHTGYLACTGGGGTYGCRWVHCDGTP